MDQNKVGKNGHSHRKYKPLVLPTVPNNQSLDLVRQSSSEVIKNAKQWCALQVCDAIVKVIRMLVIGHSISFNHTFLIPELPLFVNFYQF